MAHRDKKHPVIICISSGKGGVGKTSLAVNLGLGLSRQGLRVLIVDGDMGLANVDLLLGLDVDRTVRDVLDAGIDPAAALAWFESRLAVLPAASGVPEMVTMGPEEQDRLRKALGRVTDGFDLVLLDTAAGIGPGVLWFNRLAHRNIVVMTPDPTAVTDAYALIKVLVQRQGRDRFQVVVNETATEQEGREVFDNLARVASAYLKVQLVFLGTIPRDSTVRRAVRAQQPFWSGVPDGPAARAVGGIMGRVRRLISQA